MKYNPCIQGNQTLLSSITLLSESELKLDIGNGENSRFTVLYSEKDGKILEEFNLSFDGDNRIVSRVCNRLYQAPSEYLSAREANFYINDLSAKDRAELDFIGEGFVVGDTVAYCILNNIYKLK